MPATDKCEPIVIRALQKVGWYVTDQPYTMRQGKDIFYADLRLQSQDDSKRMLVVEVKCFSEKRSYIHELYHVLGQYLFYRQMLLQLELDYELYVTIPDAVYDELIQRVTVQNILSKNDVQIIIINLDNEEVVRWISNK
ncbi:MAG: element excision factor XisH family protein [Aggregatilineales bacterium]